jgi:putative Ca2+/H+ antiporter (TMEM165/GDT1 family)
MEALLNSVFVVAVAEIGDRTQLLSIVLASRFRRPLPILCGILVATIANHALAGIAGELVGDLLTGSVLRWVLAASFLAMAAWAIVPDKLGGDGDGDDVVGVTTRGPFLATLCSFFVAEMGDKTQLATAALAARFDALAWVVIGTTTGMMIANVPAVLFGHFAGNRIDPRWARYVAAAIFAAQGVLAALGIRLG